MRVTNLPSTVVGLLALGLGASGLGACDDATLQGTGDAAGDVATTPDEGAGDTASDADPAVTAAAGKLVDRDGQPVVGASVLACTAATCFTTDSGADGTFLATGMPAGPHKMQIIGEPFGLASVLYYEDVVAGETVTAPRPIVLSPLDAETVPWPAADGGTVTIAGGRLRLTAAPGVLRYPLGHFDQDVRGAIVAPGDLPPLNVEPWVGREAGTLAFSVSPEPILAKTGAFEVTVLGLDPSLAGATYTVWSVDADTAELNEVGTALAAADGTLALSSGEVTTLTTLIFVPAAP